MKDVLEFAGEHPFLAIVAMFLAAVTIETLIVRVSAAIIAASRSKNEQDQQR